MHEVRPAVARDARRLDGLDERPRGGVEEAQLVALADVVDVETGHRQHDRVLDRVDPRQLRALNDGKRGSALLLAGIAEGVDNRAARERERPVGRDRPELGPHIEAGVGRREEYRPAQSQKQADRHPSA